MKSFLAPIVGAFLLGIALTCLVVLLVGGPSCPTEDSCRPDYANGSWQIIEVIP